MQFHKKALSPTWNMTNSFLSVQCCIKLHHLPIQYQKVRESYITLFNEGYQQEADREYRHCITVKFIFETHQARYLYKMHVSTKAVFCISMLAFIFV